MNAKEIQPHLYDGEILRRVGHGNIRDPENIDYGPLHVTNSQRQRTLCGIDIHGMILAGAGKKKPATVCRACQEIVEIDRQGMTRDKPVLFIPEWKYEALKVKHAALLNASSKLAKRMNDSYYYAALRITDDWYEFERALKIAQEEA